MTVRIMFGLFNVLYRDENERVQAVYGGPGGGPDWPTLEAAQQGAVEWMETHSTAKLWIANSSGRPTVNGCTWDAESLEWVDCNA